MITVLIPTDSEFEKYKPQIKKYYEKYQEKIAKALYTGICEYFSKQ